MDFLQDNDPEVAETFVVNITGVQLVGGALIVGAGASVRRPGNVASITIAENDNARGIISFDVNRVRYTYMYVCYLKSPIAMRITLQ